MKFIYISIYSRMSSHPLLSLILDLPILDTLSPRCCWSHAMLDLGRGAVGWLHAHVTHITPTTITKKNRAFLVLLCSVEVTRFAALETLMSCVPF